MSAAFQAKMKTCRNNLARLEFLTTRKSPCLTVYATWTLGVSWTAQNLGKIRDEKLLLPDENGSAKEPLFHEEEDLVSKNVKMFARSIYVNRRVSILVMMAPIAVMRAMNMLTSLTSQCNGIHTWIFVTDTYWPIKSAHHSGLIWNLKHSSLYGTVHIYY